MLVPAREVIPHHPDEVRGHPRISHPAPEDKDPAPDVGHAQVGGDRRQVRPRPPGVGGHVVDLDRGEPGGASHRDPAGHHDRGRAVGPGVVDAGVVAPGMGQRGEGRPLSGGQVEGLDFGGDASGGGATRDQNLDNSRIRILLDVRRGNGTI